MRTLQSRGVDAAGIDLLAGPFTHFTGSITDRSLVRESLRGVKTVFHSATLHKPHVATHTKQDFLDTNIAGTLVLLEESVAAGVLASLSSLPVSPWVFFLSLCSPSAADLLTG